MKKKILFFLINMNLGGTEKSFLNLINALPSDNEIDLFLLENKGQLLQHLPKNVNLHIIENSEAVNFLIHNNLLSYALYSLRRGEILQTFRAIYYYIKSKFSGTSDYKFEAIQNKLASPQTIYDIAVAYAGPHQFISSYIARNVCAAKKIQWIHFDITKINLNTKAAAHIFRYFDKIYVVSKEAEKKFLEKFPYFNNKTEVYYNLIDRDKILFLSKQVKNCFEDDFRGLRIVTVGRLTEEKGHILAISAVDQLKKSGYNIRYYIVGDGNERENLASIVKTLNLQDSVFFLGLKMNPYPFIEQTDIYLQPSFYEGHCVTILEAKLLNKTIISTNFTGAAEEIEHGKTGYIVEINSESIYIGLKNLIENSEIRLSFEQNLMNENLLHIEKNVTF